MKRSLLALAFVVATLVAPFRAEEPIRYRFSFPRPAERWMQVEASFGELGDGPLELVISRSSPGRYAEHDFARGIYDVHASAADGRELAIEQVARSEWIVRDHAGLVKLAYKVYGDRLDGTYLAIDGTHAHINMPAAIMWARRLEDRPATLTFVPPADRQWQVATQLYPGATAFEFTAPNLQYLMDSPAEFGPIAIREFPVDDRKFRFAAGGEGNAEEGGARRFVELAQRAEELGYDSFMIPDHLGNQVGPIARLMYCGRATPEVDRQSSQVRHP